MASEDVERLRESFGRWNSGDRDFDETLHPEIQLRTPLTSTSGQAYRGIDGFKGWMREIDEQFDFWQLRPEEFTELDDDRILVTGEVHLRGRESGVEIDQPVVWLFEFREGLLYRYNVWTSMEDARREAGLDAVAEGMRESANRDRGG